MTSADSSELRVLLLIAEFGYGGAESDLLRLGNYLSQRCHVTIAAFEQNYRDARYCHEEPATELPLVLLGGPRDSASHILAKVKRWRRRLKDLRSLKEKSDITISFLSGPNLLNAVAGRRYPTIVSERGSKIHHTGIHPLMRIAWTKAIDPLVYRSVDRVVPVSYGYAEEVLAIAGASQRDKIVPIEGGISAAELVRQSDEEVDADIQAFCQRQTLVFCGRLDRGKGIDLLLPVFSDIAASNEDARLLVIGDGPLFARLADTASDLGLRVTMNGDPDANVFFAGYRKAPLRHYRLCKGFLFPSEHEGLPNALIEAVATGVPILAADCRYGPRSVLGLVGNEEPTIVNSALQLPYGTLLPLLSTAGAAQLWRTEIARLLQMDFNRPRPEFRLDGIRRFDLSVSGPKWLQLILDVLRERSDPI